MRIILPYHLGSGNRGCEGIARGISKIFQLDSKELIMYDISDYDYQSDMRVGLNLCGELKFSGGKGFEFLRFCCRVFKRFGFQMPYYHLLSSHYLSDANINDVLFITGGDIYCYKGEHVFPNMIAKKAKQKGLKTVLYGVSMEEKLLTPEVVDGLKLYDVIITRESLSSDTLTKVGLKNELYPDPAFALEPDEFSLPEYFSGSQVVGINFSTFTDKDSLFHENMINLINYIISKGMEVCLIPHVFWKNQDDRISMNEYVQYFGAKIHILNSENLSYLQIRYVISKCEFFIGGRTHSVISAYSTHTPCIALGYSVKAKGIASDIGMPDYTLIDSHKLQNENTLLNTFKRLEDGKEEIMEIYSRIDEYRKKSLDAREFVLHNI